MGYWHDTVVCLSVGLSVAALCIVAFRVSIGVESCCTDVFLAGNFLFTFFDAFTIGCIV